MDGTASIISLLIAPLWSQAQLTCASQRVLDKIQWIHNSFQPAVPKKSGFPVTRSTMPSTSFPLPRGVDHTDLQSMESLTRNPHKLSDFPESMDALIPMVPRTKVVVESAAPKVPPKHTDGKALPLQMLAGSRLARDPPPFLKSSQPAARDPMADKEHILRDVPHTLPVPRVDGSELRSSGACNARCTNFTLESVTYHSHESSRLSREQRMRRLPSDFHDGPTERAKQLRLSETARFIGSGTNRSSIGKGAGADSSFAKATVRKYIYISYICPLLRLRPHMSS